VGDDVDGLDIKIDLVGISFIKDRLDSIAIRTKPAIGSMKLAAQGLIGPLS
jgi:hypothetical protein